MLQSYQQEQKRQDYDARFREDTAVQSVEGFSPVI